MNCTECRDTVAADLEGLLAAELARQRREHLAACETCRAEDAAVRRLHERLAAGARDAQVSFVAPVMREVLRIQAEKERQSLMIKSMIRWVLGLGAAGAAAAIVAISLMAPSKASAKAEEILIRGAEAAANLHSVHLKGLMRTPPADNFMAINPASDFAAIEFWWQWGSEVPQAGATGKWRVEKPGRVALMDGQTTLLYLRPLNYAMKVARPTLGAFDTGWLVRIASLSQALTNELENAKAKGWQLQVSAETGADGRPKSIVTVLAKSGLPDNDYLKNKFFDLADTRRVYRFDDGTAHLEDVAVSLTTDAGDVKVIELSQIDYDEDIDPSVFHLDLPANVQWDKEPQILPDNQKYVAMTAEQATQAFFKALQNSDWTEAAKFCPFPFNQQIRDAVGGLQIVSLGQPFTSKVNEAQFVPYSIKLKSGDVQTNNLALKRDPKTGRWFVDGGF